MDWNFAIEKHTEALKQVLAMLVAMAAVFEGSRTLPRHLHRSILRLLRPAEAAVRRLIIIAARGLVVPLSPCKLEARPAVLHRGVGTGIVDTGISMFQLGLANVAPPPIRKPCAPLLAFPLTDTLRGLPRRPRRLVATSVPRISGSSHAAPSRVPPRRPLSSTDPVNADRLHCRLQIIFRALDDLPGQAKRFACWRARRDRAVARRRLHRLTPLRPGRPPGWRKPGSRRAHEVHSVLHDLHGLAIWTLEEKPDTS